MVFLSASKHGGHWYIVSSKGLLVMSARVRLLGGERKALHVTTTHASVDHARSCLALGFQERALVPRYQSTLRLPGSIFCGSVKLQALIYIFLPTTALTDYAIGLGKVSANEQFFVGA